MKTNYLKFGLWVMFLLVLATSAMAETRPVRGYLQNQNSAPLADESVFVVVKVHSNTDYPCYCHTYEVFTSGIGEFVSDLGNLYYSENCEFWKKQQGESCYNDWMEGDWVLINALGELRAVRKIDKNSIFEVGQLVYGQETVQSQETSSATLSDNLKKEIIIEPELTEIKENGLDIESIGMSLEDGAYFVNTKIINPTESNFDNLMLEVKTKDLGGQVSGVLKSETFSLASQESKEIKLKWEANTNSGIYLVSSVLYKSDQTAAASKEIQVVVDKDLPQNKFFLLETPSGIRYLDIFIVFILILVVAIEIVILKRQKDKKTKIKR